MYLPKMQFARIMKLAALVAAIFLLLGEAFLSAPLQAAKPSDPAVQKMIAAGIRFLRSPEGSKSYGHQEGEEMLVAYAIYKVEYNADDPLVRRGVRRAQEYSKMEVRKVQGRTYANYELSVAILLLAEVDPGGFSTELKSLRDTLLAGQRNHGGYGYYSEQQGDISQAQYAMLAMWTLAKNGYDIPSNSIISLCTFFLRSQGPNGGWGYKANLAPSISQHVVQDNRVSPTLTMGGAGSVLMAGEIFDFWTSANYSDPSMEHFPRAFRPADQTRSQLNRAAESAGLKSQVLLGAAKKAEIYLQNPPPGPRYRPYYEMYTQERFESFLEIAKGDVQDEPAWYNQGVSKLRGLQDASGSWGGKGQNVKGFLNNDEDNVATAFAILYLIRSTKKAIKSLSEATARGGYQLPTDTTEIRMEGGQVKGKPVAGELDGLLGSLEGDAADDLDGKSIPEDLALSTDPTTRRQQLDRLERLVRGSQSWQARRVAARVLGQSGEIKVVPSLIFALSDPDLSVKRFARDGLRFISRRFEGFEMPDRPSDQEWKAAQQAWRDWYLSFDPGYVFLDSDL